MSKRGGMMSRGSKVERKTIEKNRRKEMKFLCMKLLSLIPPQHFHPPKEFLSQQDQIEQAADYIQKLSARVEELRRRKAQALNISGNGSRRKCPNTSRSLPVFRVRDLGSSLEVALISGLRKNFMLHQIVGVLEEEGAEVVMASISNADDKIFHTLHAQVKIARVGVDIPRICERLEALIC